LGIDKRADGGLLLLQESAEVVAQGRLHEDLPWPQNFRPAVKLRA
jgi:hypothetical protein